MLRPLELVDDEASSVTAVPAATLVADGTTDATGPALTERLMLAEVVPPTLSVTVSLTTTVPAAVGTNVAVELVVIPERLPDAPPLSMVHA